MLWPRKKPIRFVSGMIQLIHVRTDHNKVSKKLETVPELTIAMMPFLPDQQLALAFAQQMIQDNRKFQGYLPFGDYQMGETSFSVSQGIVVRSGC